MKTALEFKLQQAKSDFKEQAARFNRMSSFPDNGIDCLDMIPCLREMAETAWLIRAYSSVLNDPLAKENRRR